MDTRQFGEKLVNVVYQPRPSVYAVIFDNSDRVLVIFKREMYFLPGGGIDQGETERAALIRECLEETGHEIVMGESLGRADQYCFAPVQRKYVNKLGTFYRAILDNQAAHPVLEAHKIKWVTVAEFETRPAHESHLWAVKQALRTGTNS